MTGNRRPILIDTDTASDDAAAPDPHAPAHKGKLK
jgi:hypothetical protein